MKKLLLIMLACFFASQLFAQKTEFSFGLHGGFMRFSGPSSASSTTITEGPVNYTNTPYGRKFGPGFGGYIQGQYLIKDRFFVGLQIGADALKSKVRITKVNRTYYPFIFDAQGSANISSHSINASPYVGVRLPFLVVDLDLTAGFETAYVLTRMMKDRLKMKGYYF